MSATRCFLVSVTTATLWLAGCSSETKVNEGPLDTRGRTDSVAAVVDLATQELAPLDRFVAPDVFEWRFEPDVAVVGDVNEVSPLDLPPWPPKDTYEALAADLAEEGTQIQDLQNSADSLECVVKFGAMLVGVDIVLKKRIVTAPPYAYAFAPQDLHGFYLMDPAGGPYSGIHATYPSAQVPQLKPGMVVTVTGDHKETFCFTIFQAKSILVDSEGPAPTPYITTPADIAADPEAFEGVFVRIEKVTVTDENPDLSNGYDYHEFVVDDLLRIGNDYQLKYMTLPTDARKVGDVFDYIQGVVKYSQESFHLMPRFDGDMLLEGEQPPADDPAVEYVELGPDIVEAPDALVDAYEVMEDLSLSDVPGDPDLPTVADVSVQDVPVVIPDQPGSPVVITEIMADPNGIPDDKGEWFEVVNAIDEPIDINGWRIEDGTGQMHIIMNGGPFVLQPGQILVFGSNAIESTNGGVEVNYQYPYSDFQMANDADSVVLKNLYGEVVDAVHYDKFSGWPVPKGASLQLAHPNLDNDDPVFWSASTEPYGDKGNSGTPGLLP